MEGPPPPPPMPPPPVPTSNLLQQNDKPDRSGLLSQIRAGTKLKKVTENGKRKSVQPVNAAELLAQEMKKRVRLNILEKLCCVFVLSVNSNPP